MRCYRNTQLAFRCHSWYYTRRRALDHTRSDTVLPNQPGFVKRNVKPQTGFDFWEGRSLTIGLKGFARASYVMLQAQPNLCSAR